MPANSTFADVATEVCVSAYAPESEATRLFLHHKLPLLPVVDRDGGLVGVVKTRRTFELLEEQETRQLVRFGGTLPLSVAGGPDLDVLADPLKRLFLGRFVWLAILTFFGVFTSTFVAHQEEMLAQVIVLAAYITPIIDMGGNRGSQTATLVIRGWRWGSCARSGATSGGSCAAISLSPSRRECPSPSWRRSWHTSPEAWA